jgi:sec-independent protein translocase protein TatC
MTTQIEMPKVPITEHLVDLRRRLVRSAFAVLIGFGLCYSFSESLVRFLTQPMVNALGTNGKFVYLGPAEAFMVHMKVSLVAGLFLVMPYIFYQFWLFLAPGLFKHERKLIWPTVLAATLLFLTGSSFAYFVVFPFGFKFFASYTTSYLIFQPHLDAYVSFAWKLLFVFGLIFELPLVSFMLSKIGLVNYKMLKRSRRYAIVGIFIVAAVFTPPDVMSQMLMAVPMLFLFEISIWVSYFFGKRPEPAVEDDTGDSSLPA